MPRKPKTPKPDTSLVLRICGPEGESHGDFRWPLTVGAEVVAPDWSPREQCGNGLHGWLYGAGDHSVSGRINEKGAKWMAVEVVTADLVMLGGKVKFPRCVIRAVGDKKDATDYILANEPRVKPELVIGACIVVGDGKTATAGNSGTATAGNSGTATAGEKGEIRIRWYDSKHGRMRTAVGYIGEDGLLPNVKYRLDANHKFVAA